MKRVLVVFLALLAFSSCDKPRAQRMAPRWRIFSADELKSWRSGYQGKLLEISAGGSTFAVPTQSYFDVHVPDYAGNKPSVTFYVDKGGPSPEKVDMVLRASVRVDLDFEDSPMRFEDYVRQHPRSALEAKTFNLPGRTPLSVLSSDLSCRADGGGQRKRPGPSLEWNIGQEQVLLNCDLLNYRIEKPGVVLSCRGRGTMQGGAFSVTSVVDAPDGCEEPLSEIIGAMMDIPAIISTFSR